MFQQIFTHGLFIFLQLLWTLTRKTVAQCFVLLSMWMFNNGKHNVKYISIKSTRRNNSCSVGDVPLDSWRVGVGGNQSIFSWIICFSKGFMAYHSHLKSFHSPPKFWEIVSWPSRIPSGPLPAGIYDSSLREIQQSYALINVLENISSI